MSDAHSKHHVHETAPLHDTTDSWHDHSHDAKPQHAHAEVQNTPMIMGVGLALFMVIIFSVVAVYGFYTWYIARTLDSQEITTAGAPALEWRDAMDKELKLIQTGGTVTLPAAEEGKPGRTVNIIALDKARAAVVEQYAPKMTSPTAAAPAAAEPTKD
jgi:hypothetical protein